MPLDSEPRPTLARWINLTRFGAALKIQPKSALRPAMAVLEVRDRNAFMRPHDIALGIDAAANSDEAYAISRAARQRVDQALAALGFDLENMLTLPYDEALGQHPQQLRSLKTRFTVPDLAPVFPDISAADMVEMPFSAFVIEPTIDEKEAWDAYLQTMVTTAAPIWVPRRENLESDYAKARSLANMDPAKRGETGPKWMDHARVLPHRAMRMLLSADYRENALMTCYADQASALADGWAAEELESKTLPYALPLWVNPAGRVLAFRDIRLATEIMDSPPASALGPLPSQLFDLMRRLPAAREAVAAQWQRWQVWAEDPEALRDHGELSASLQVVADAMATLTPITNQFGLHGWVEDRAPNGDPNAPLVVRPLPSIDPAALGWLASGCRSLGVGEDVTTAVMQDTMSKVLAHALARVKEAVVARARADLDALPRQVLDAAGDGKTHHVDVGEHIGGARKDFARRAMVLEDLATFTDAERSALVTKKNVWPPLDYKAMRERGVNAHAAWAIKQLKDTLATSPDRSDGEGSEAEAHYIEAIAYVRDALAPVRTLEELGPVLQTIYQHGVIAGTGHPNDPNRRLISGHGRFQIQWGRDFATMVYEGGADDRPSLPYRIRNTLHRRVSEDPNNWSALIKSKKVKDPDEEAEDKAKAKTDRELHRPHLEHVQRSGEDWRHGRDVTGDDLMATFGFRAVEFGNWLPQDERQDVVNMAYDSFADLAQALDLPPEAISLDHTLAIAFGSRGHGGQHAALAHYEPARVVINLTRMKGAGTLAHEWTHAWDHHMGHGESAVESAKIPNPLGELALAMQQCPADPDVLHDTAWEGAKRGTDNVASWLYLQPAEDRARLKDVVESLFGEVHRRIEANAAAHIGDFCANTRMDAWLTRGVGGIDLNSLHDDFLALVKKACPNRPGFTKVRDKISGNVRYLLHQLSTACTIDAARAAHLTLPPAFLGFANSATTQYLVEARKLDKLRSKPYWATPLEMFARAGAAFVSDQLERRGVRNDYLVYGADEKRYANHPVGNPNPVGVEREVLNGHFQSLLDEYRLRHVAATAPQP